MNSYWFVVHHFTLVFFYFCAVNGSGSGSSVTDSVTTRRRRTLYNGLSRTADNPRGIMMADNGKDRDVEEGSEILTEKTLNDYMPIVNGELVGTACTNARCMTLSV